MTNNKNQRTLLTTPFPWGGMGRGLLLLCFFAFLLPASAQSQRRTTSKKTSTTQTQKKRNNTQQKQKTQKKPTKAELQKQKQDMARQRQLQQKRAEELNRNIKQSLDSVLILDNQIGRQRVAIDSLSGEIKGLEQQIDTLERELDRLQRELADKKQKYARAMVYMQRHKSVQEKLMFVFSARNFEQLVRRMRYVREYSTFQRVQGEMIKEKAAEVKRKQNELLNAKTKLETARVAMQEKRRMLETSKQSCEKNVQFLNQNLATVQKQIAEYKQKEAAINAQIDRIIQEEIAEARRKAEAERKRREEEARRRAEAERAANNKKSGSSSKKSGSTGNAKKSGTAPTTDRWFEEDAADRRLSNNFAQNRGRLPMPITGSYSVVGHYGTYTVPGLKNVTLDNKGIDIRGQQGAQARAVFDGTVSSVFQYGGQYIVMVRHGQYISVYSGLQSVNVAKGTKVTTKQTLGTVGRNDDGNYVLHFQLRNLTSRLNPEQWVR
ncbi:MAG: peptidoglycan DD-metalloendopeptidase family protein [Bacteroidales bacterium]|nr:peptidoglycan DD-metalloendopeptidase family protein [Bacteroidales bacterium]